jgi:chorismate synthase
MSHNTFGHLFRVTTWGESHGPAIGCVIDGCPPRIPLAAAEIQAALDRRRPGRSRFTTQRREPDEVRILSGVFEDDATGGTVTTGTPISLLIENVDQRSKDYSDIRERYRPGHADYSYDVKYGVRDYRGGGRSSARETAMRVAAGAVALKVVPGLSVRGALVEMGGDAIDRASWDWAEVEQNPFFCPDARAAARWEEMLDAARKAGSSLGAVIEAVAEGVPAGLGAPVYGKLDQDIASALMSINAVKGVEIGDGFAAARLRGEENADGPAGRRALRREAHLVDPHAGAQRHALRRGRGGDDEGPPRPLRRHPRRAGRRGDARHRAGRPLPAPSRADRRVIRAFERRPGLRHRECGVARRLTRFRRAGVASAPDASGATPVAAFARRAAPASPPHGRGPTAGAARGARAGRRSGWRPQAGSAPRQ